MIRLNEHGNGLASSRQGHAKPMYRSAENPRAAGRQKTG